MLIVVFLGSLISPQGGDWAASFSSLIEGNGWIFSDGAILAKLQNQDIYASLEVAKNAGDLEQVTFLKDKLGFVNGSRLFLLVVYLLLCGIVYKAYSNRKKEGRPI